MGYVRKSVTEEMAISAKETALKIIANHAFHQANCKGKSLFEIEEVYGSLDGQTITAACSSSWIEKATQYKVKIIKYCKDRVTLAEIKGKNREDDKCDNDDDKDDENELIFDTCQGKGNKLWK